MKSMYVKIVLFVLIAGLLSACGTPQTGAPAAPATDTAASATEAHTDVPPVTDTAAGTEPPAATDPAAATQPPVQGATVSFANEVLPIIQSRCISCHGGDRTEEGLDLKTHASILAGSENGLVIIPGDAANSLLVEMVVTQKMPKRGPKLTPPQLQLITDWVNQGALDN